MTERRWPRMKLALEVHMRFEDVDDAVEGVAARTTNISREGMFIRMDPPKPIGTHVRVRLAVARHEIVLEGTVVRAVEDGPVPGVGVHLTTACDDWARLCELVEERRRGAAADETDIDIPIDVEEPEA